MAHNNQQLIRVAVQVLRATRGKLGLGGVIGLVLAAVLYVAVLQPLAASRLGIDLPTIGSTHDPPSVERSEERPQDGTNSRSDESRSAEKPTAKQVDPRDYPEVLTDLGRGAYRSEGGLRYTRGSQQGHRLAHVMYHAADVPDRVGQHGVFDSDDPIEVVRLIDEAYGIAQTGKDTKSDPAGNRIAYTINLRRRIGYIGGQSGNRRGKPAARHLKLVLEGDRVITAFPIRP